MATIEKKTAVSLLAGILIVVMATAFIATNTSAQTCPPGMVSYWNLDEGTGTTASDSVGTNDGTLMFGPAWTTGRVNGALDFNGSINYVRVADSATLNVTQGITLEAWIYPTEVQATRVQDIISKHASQWVGYPFYGGVDDAYVLQLHPPSKLKFVLSDGAVYYVGLLSNNDFANNTWYHVVGTWDGSTMKIYINGVQDPNTSSFQGPIHISSLPLGIGRNGGDGWSEYFGGIIDEAAIYERALTPAEITQHYQNGLEGLNYCEVSPELSLSCQGFEPPMDKGPVTIKKHRVLPLKSTLFYNDVQVTDLDIVARPVIQISYSSGVGNAVDVTDYALAAGQGTEGNQFLFDGTWWHFNLETKNYSAPGTYSVTMRSGDETEYTIDPTCEAQFVIE